ncbi:MAG TPA: hypothetical protein DHU89_02375 [Flavobacteriales bacterium]|nr:hypothetical protein [Flavobacteriales bacterium]|tara:strand:+ start:9268 stop:9720 length:453 start_codon:yes stop_codon:yes gene_type:complete
MNYLFPHQYKKIGLMALIPSVILGVVVIITDFAPEFLDIKIDFVLSANPFTKSTNNLLNEILGILVILSGVVVAFSKEKVEDEFIEKIRLESLVWSVYVNYALLFLAMVILYDFDFLFFMTFNMFTLLIFFIVKFNWRISKLKKTSFDEK